LDLALKTIVASGRGPIGILATQDDAEARLQDNLDGPAPVPQLIGQPAGKQSTPPRLFPRPKPAAKSHAHRARAPGRRSWAHC
jgi:hypothetical protein